MLLHQSHSISLGSFFVDHQKATEFLNSLLDIVRDDAAHPLYSLVSVVGDLIEAYEIDHEPL